MANNSANKKTNTGGGFNINSISGVLNLILMAFSLPEEPASTPPPPLILAGAKLRPVRMSHNTTTARVISRLSEAGLPVGDVFADGTNSTEAMIKIIVEEVINTLQTEAVITCVMAPVLAVSTIGIGNMGAPVISQGATTAIGTITGVIT